MSQPLQPERERLASFDDQATATEIAMRQAAFAAQQERARHAHVGKPGICSNCEAHCLPTAVYCDASCRADHEARLTAQRRLRGRA